MATKSLTASNYDEKTSSTHSSSGITLPSDQEFASSSSPFHYQNTPATTPSPRHQPLDDGPSIDLEVSSLTVEAASSTASSKITSARSSGSDATPSGPHEISYMGQGTDASGSGLPGYCEFCRTHEYQLREFRISTGTTADGDVVETHESRSKSCTVCAGTEMTYAQAPVTRPESRKLQYAILSIIITFAMTVACLAVKPVRPFLAPSVYLFTLLLLSRAAPTSRATRFILLAGAIVVTYALFRLE